MKERKKERPLEIDLGLVFFSESVLQGFKLGCHVCVVTLHSLHVLLASSNLLLDRFQFSEGGLGTERSN